MYIIFPQMDHVDIARLACVSQRMKRFVYTYFETYKQLRIKHRTNCSALAKWPCLPHLTKIEALKLYIDQDNIILPCKSAHYIKLGVRRSKSLCIETLSQTLNIHPQSEERCMFFHEEATVTKRRRITE